MSVVVDISVVSWRCPLLVGVRFKEISVLKRFLLVEISFYVKAGGAFNYGSR